MKNKFSLAAILCIVCVVIGIIAVSVLLINKYSVSNALCDAIAADDPERVLELIDKVYDVNTYTAPPFLYRVLSSMEISIRSPLVEACRAGNPEIVKALLTKGADPNQCLQGYWSPIEATFLKPNANRLEIAQLLLSHGAEVDLYGSGDSALFNELQNMLYSQNPETIDSKAVLLLLENGAAPVDAKGNTIMHYVCYIGDMDLLHKLSDMYGKYLYQQNEQGQTPLMWAIEGDAEEVIDYLKAGDTSPS